MYTVYMKGNSTIYCPGFKSWNAANKWGRAMFGPGNFDIEMEQYTTKQHKYCASCPIDFRRESGIMNT